MKDKGEATWRHSLRLMCPVNGFYGRYQDYLLIIPYLSLGVRKDILRVARVQCSIKANPFFYSSLMVHKPEHSNRSNSLLSNQHLVSNRDIVSELSFGCHADPAFSALVSVLVRSAPIFHLSEAHVEQNRVDSWEKEIDASTGPDRPQQLDYSPWFDEQKQDVPLSHYLEPAPGLNLQIHRVLLEWRESFRGRTLYPQTSSFRHLSRNSAYRYACSKACSSVAEYDIDVSTRTIERYYMDTGRTPGGVAELRQAWKYNEITPRTYFALGSTTYHASKYIRPVANSLCNMFPATNFRTRFSIQTSLPPAHTAFTYDYSSFTSNLTELKYFLKELAVFCKGVEIHLLDSHVGIITSDLGDLIMEYVESTTIHPEFSIHRYLSHVLEPIIHQKAGMLGVYGNIAFSTSLHGLHACQICGTLDCNCVGDDFFGSKDLKDMEELVASVEAIGSINRQKFKFWRPGETEEDQMELKNRWPFLKRPLDRVGNRMIHEIALSLPIFGEIIPIEDGFHDPHEGISKQLLATLASQVRSLVRQLRVFPLHPEQLELIQAYVHTLYKAWELPADGNPPFLAFRHRSSGIIMNNWLLPSIEALGSGDEWSGFGIVFEPQAYTVPRYSSDEHDPFAFSRLDMMGEAEMASHPFLTYCTHLEVLEAEQIFDEKYFATLFEYVQYYNLPFEHDSRVVYRVRKLSVPEWFSSMCIWLAVCP